MGATTIQSGDEFNALGKVIIGAAWFINNIKIRLVGIIISGLMFTMLALGIASGVWSGAKVANIAAHWGRFDTGGASKQALMDQIRSRLGYGGLLLQIKMIAARNGDAATAISAAKEATGEVRELVAAYRSAGISADEENALTQLLSVVASYEAALDLAARRPGPEAAQRLLVIDDDKAIQSLGVLSASVEQDSRLAANDLDGDLSSLKVSIFGTLVMATVLLLVLAVFFHWFTRYRVVAPVGAMQEVMARLTRGDKGIEVPFQQKRDEIGDMARAVEVFKENAIRLDMMAEEQRRTEAAAEVARRRDMVALADRFETEVKAVVDSVSAAASELQGLAAEMTSMADQAAAGAGEVASAACRVSDDVTSSAAAAEELSASIQEIRRQVGDSGRIAEAAIKDAEQARAVMLELSGASERIDHIVQLIETLAHRTDLLALNATIEAMRAGEMGKGFAVVAGEVKNLSAQTAKATGDITTQVGNIKAVSGDAVRAISAINVTIENIHAIAGAVAISVEQQTEATQEISRGVDRTASETRMVSERMNEVTQINTGTGDAARKVLLASSHLGEQAVRLSSQVGNFVAHVRSA